MTTVADIQSCLEAIAPTAKKMDWDNAGLLCGHSSKVVRKVLIALDPFEDVVEEAVQTNCDMIVTHHPLIFRPVYSVTEDTGVGRTIRMLIRNDISAYNLHTNLDLAPGGVNQVLAQRLGLKNIEVIDPEYTDDDGQLWGLLRCGEVDPMPLSYFLAHVKDILHTPVLRYAQGTNVVHRVAVGGGACADQLATVIRAGCDTFVTSDAKYNQFWDAHDSKINLIDAGHFYTENPICESLRQVLQTAFPNLDIRISQVHKDCMQFF